MLLIEDNPGDARLVRELLGETRGRSFELEWAESLGAGLEHLAAERFDVILLDLELSDSLGLETLAATQEAAPAVPVIVMTSLDDEDLAATAVRNGAQDYLVKGMVEPNLLSRSILYAIERKQLFQLNEALNRISMMVNSTLDFDEMMQKVLAETAQTIGAESAVFMVMKDDKLLIRVTWGITNDLPVGGLFPTEQIKVAELVHTTGEPIVISDVREDERCNQERMQSAGVLSLIACPLYAKNEVIGVIAFRYHTRRAEFSKATIEFLQRLSTLVSLARENARLYNTELEARNKIQGYANQLALLHEIGISLNRETDTEMLLKQVLSAAAEITKAGIGAMILVEQDKTKLISMYYSPWFEERCTITNDPSNLHKRVELLVAASERDTIRITDFDLLGQPLEFPEGHPRLTGLLIGTVRDTLDRAQGYFMLSSKGEGAPFTVEDEEIISLLAAQASVALISAENFEREHRVAATLQSALMPKTPRRDDMEIGLVYHSATSFSRLGGDFYDFIDMAGGSLAVVIGDVCGKGLEAATSTAMIKYSLRACMNTESDPAKCLSSVNSVAARQIAMEKFVTVGLMILNPAEHFIHYASAGHPPPVLLGNGSAQVLASSQSLPLGVLPDFEFSKTTIPANPGTTIVLYSDGLTEARLPEREPYGEKRVLRKIEELGGLPPQDMANQLMEAAVEYSGGQLRDDIAVLVIRLR